MTLAVEQEDLLRKLVEAERRVPRERRRPFMLSWSAAHRNPGLTHEGWPSDDRPYEPDLQLLFSAGLLHLTHRDQHSYAFIVTPDGHNYYEQIQQRRGEAVQRLEEHTLLPIHGERFLERYPAARQKWFEAERLLWSSDSSDAHSTIGHLTREAMVEFIDALVTRLGVDTTSDRTRTLDRVRAALDLARPQLGERATEFLDALLVYWGTVWDLIQRQEHAVGRTSSPLAFDDSRRVVFQTALVFYELDLAFQNVRPVG